MTQGKTVPELGEILAPVAGTDEMVFYRAPGPLRRTTAAAVQSFFIAGTEAAAAAAAADALLAQQYAADAAGVSGVNVPSYASRASLAGATVVAAIKQIATRGYAAEGDGGGANYVRTSFATITSEGYPASAYQRSVDRFMPDGTTDAVNGGYWLLLEPVISPEMLGAVGDGLTLDVVPLKDAVTTAQASGVVALKPAAVYLTDRPITTLTGQKIIGNGATLKRVPQVVTTTTTAITSGVTTSVTLTDATGLAIGQTVCFAQLSVTRANVVYGVTLSAPRTITNVVGNTITLNAAPNIAVSIGGTCFLTFAQIVLGEGSTVDGVVFDGTRANWSYSRWEVTQEVTTLNPGPATKNHKIKNNTFLDAPGEAVLLYGGSSTVSGNTYATIGGNGIHLSGCTDVSIFNEKASNGNIDTAISHQDGFVSFSNSNSKIRISDIYAEDFISGLGAMNNTDADITAENCDFVDMYCFGIDGGAGVFGLKFSDIRIRGVALDITKVPGRPYYGGVIFIGISATDYDFDNITVTGVAAGVNNRSIVISGTGSADHLVTVANCHFTGDALFASVNGFSYIDNDFVGGNIVLSNGVNGEISGGSITPTSGQIAFSMNAATYENLQLLDRTRITGGNFGISVGSSTASLKAVTIGRAVLYDQITGAISVSSTAATVEGLCFDGTVVRAGPAAAAGFYGVNDALDGVVFNNMRLTNHQGASSRVGIRTTSLASAPNTVVKGAVITGDWLHTIQPAASSGMFAADNVLMKATSNPSGNNISGEVVL